MFSISSLSIKNNLKEELKKIDKLDIAYHHIDIMDGIFVNNENIIDVSYLDKLKKPLDIHLMVKDNKKYIDKYQILNPEYITIHAENATLEEINYIKSFGIKAGLAINPNTDINILIEYLDIIDLIIVMGVEAGYGGQRFIPKTIDRINYLNDIRNKNNYSYLISVDGGINSDNIKDIKTDIYVVGSYITNGDYEKNLEALCVREN